MKRVILKAGEERRIKRGHPWVYVNEIEAVLAGPGANAARAELEAGECADVETTAGRKPEYLGRAIVNPVSQIAARLYSRSKEGLDKGFFKRRIREALERREAAGYDLSRDSCRAVFGEADSLPGLIIDRFVGEGGDSWLAIQFLAFGMDVRREMILDALEETLPFRGAIEKAAPTRELEGLGGGDSRLRGEVPEGGFVISENGLLFKVDLSGGQKTGFYLDQRDNRRRAGTYAAALAKNCAARGKPFRALDGCSYSGGFALRIAAAGAAVRAVDVSAAALGLVRENAVLNGLSEAVEAVESDIFDFLRKAARRRERFDLIILDPPAFAKNRAALENALRGYREINLMALKLLEKGGILITCSCSQAVNEARFKAVIRDAAADADARLLQLDFRYQAPDHPILTGYDESLYLKCGFYRKL